MSNTEEMRISAHGLALLKEFEQYRSKAYKATPAEKYYTIGWGHYGADVKPDDVITPEAAERLLREDLLGFEMTMNAWFRKKGVKLNQNQYDAVLSLIYNIGTLQFFGSSKVEPSTMWKLLQKGEYRRAADEFPRWNKQNGVPLTGLTKRRAKERALYLSEY